MTRVGSDADDDLEREVDQIMNDILGGYQSATETESDSDSSLQMDDPYNDTIYSLLHPHTFVQVCTQIFFKPCNRTTYIFLCSNIWL